MLPHADTADTSQIEFNFEDGVDGQPLQPRLAPLAAVSSQATDDPRYVLPYHHFSVVLNKERRLAFFTAVNIDGAERTVEPAHRALVRVGAQDLFREPAAARPLYLVGEFLIAPPPPKQHCPPRPLSAALAGVAAIPAQRRPVRDNPEVPGRHTRVRTGLIPIDGSRRRRQP